MELEGLADRRVVVVGAGGGGIGTAITCAIADAGATVVAIDRDAQALDAVVRSSGDSSRIVPECCDAGDDAALGAAIARHAADGAALHGLVNVVGGLPPERWRALVDDDDENMDALLESNLRVALRSSRAFARAVRSAGRGGSVVQIASIAALQGMPFGAGYAASKAALLSLTRTMALEWGSLGIRVNAVAPGSVVVPRSSAGADTAQGASVLPLGRRGEPSDIANAVLFLLSDLSRWITGQVLVVDGGASIKPSYLDEHGLPVFVQDGALRERLKAR